MTTGTKIGAGFALVLALIVALGVNSYVGTQRLIDANRRVMHTHQVLDALKNVLSEVKDAETGQRGFVLTGEEPDLEPWQVAGVQIPRDLELLKELTLDDPAQQAGIAQIQALTEARLAELRKIIDLRRKSGLEAALQAIRAGQGKKIMDDLQDNITRMQTREQQQLGIRNDSANAIAQLTIKTVAIWTPLSLLLLAVFAMFVTRKVRFGGPGILATVLAALAAAYFFLPPYGRFAVGAPNDILALSILTAANLFLCVFAERLRRARWAEAVSTAQEEELSQRRRVEAALREWLQVTLTSIGDAVIAGDTAGRVTFLNPVAESLTGWNAAEAQGKPIQSVLKIIMVSDRFLSDYRLGEDDIIGKSHYEIFPEIPERWRKVHQRCLAGAIESAEEEAFPRADGLMDYVRWEMRPWHDAQGQIGGIVLYSEVITERKRAELALRENRELLRAVIEGTSDAVYVKDLAGRYLLFNAAAGRFTGKSPEEVIGQDDTALFPLDEAKAVMAGDRAVLASGQIMTYEEHVTDPLGKRLTFLSTKGPLRDGQGRVTALFGIARDITDLKRAEEEMRESEARYRSLFENMLNGFAYCRMVFDRGRPEDFIYLDVNGAFETLTGLKNVAGKKVSEVIPGIREADPELFEIYGRVARTGIPERFEKYVKALEMWFDISVYSPGKEYFVAVFDVITERKRTDEAMRVSEHRERERAAELATFLDAAPTPVFIAHDPDCLHLTGNRAADDLLRLPRGAETSLSAPDEVKPRHFRAVKDGRELNNDELPAQRAARGEQVRDFEFSLAFDDGTTRHVVGYGTPLRNEKGEPRGAVHVLVDITDRKQAEEALRAANARLAEADRRKDEFLAMLAHELRNPISPVRSAVEILRLAGPKDPILMRQRDIIDRQITHMARLLDDLLDVSRITRGKIELKRQPLHLDDVLVHAAETATPLIESRRHTLTLALPSDSLRVEGDLDRLSQAIGNLLTNAAKYTEEGGKIWLEAGREMGEAVIRVRDTGAGIAPEMLPRVFDLFAQADCTLARAKGGLGIGLTMVKKLVEMHGGSVEARSAGLGQGSEFIIRLPALEGEAPVPVRPDRPEERAPTPPRRILVVDDIADSADSLAQMLVLSGHDARAVYDGPSALKMLCDFVPEVVLLDIGMPGMDGYEVVRHMRQKECGRKTLLVALTGYAQESDKDAAREAGFDYHLAKPVDLSALHDLLAHADARLA